MAHSFSAYHGVATIGQSLVLPSVTRHNQVGAHPTKLRCGAPDPHCFAIFDRRELRRVYVVLAKADSAAHDLSRKKTRMGAEFHGTDRSALFRGYQPGSVYEYRDRS
jgi:hypothetical protein